LEIIYTGERKKGKKSGNSENIHPSRAKRGKDVGECKEGKRSGHGEYTYPDIEKYVTEWKDGMMRGQAW
jgi:hypothetical protein